jgi:hypothetical protein
MSRTEYAYGGARALVQLHARSMREFLDVWRKAKSAGLTMPPTDDPDCASLEAMLYHVLAAGRGYMTWMCEKLELPDPEIRPAPDSGDVATEAGDYLEHLLECWDGPLREMTEKQSYLPEFESRWKVKYCIDAMLEHAVMHPIRHTFQLQKLMGAAPGG